MKTKKIEKIELELSYEEFSIMSIAISMFSEAKLNQPVKDHYQETGSGYVGLTDYENSVIDGLAVALMKDYNKLDMKLDSDD